MTRLPQNILNTSTATSTNTDAQQRRLTYGTKTNPLTNSWKNKSTNGKTHTTNSPQANFSMNKNHGDYQAFSPGTNTTFITSSRNILSHLQNPPPANLMLTTGTPLSKIPPECTPCGAKSLWHATPILKSPFKNSIGFISIPMLSKRNNPEHGNASLATSPFNPLDTSKKNRNHNYYSPIAPDTHPQFERPTTNLAPNKIQTNPDLKHLIGIRTNRQIAHD